MKKIIVRIFCVVCVIFFMVNILYTIVFVYMTQKEYSAYSEMLREKNSFIDFMWEMNINDVDALRKSLDNDERMKFWQSIILQRKTSISEIEDMFVFDNHKLLKRVIVDDSLKFSLNKYRDFDSTITFNSALEFIDRPLNYKRKEIFLFKDSILVDILDDCNSLHDSLWVNVFMSNAIKEPNLDNMFCSDAKDDVVCFENLYCYRHNDYIVYCTQNNAVISVFFKDSNGYYERYFDISRDYILEEYKNIHALAERIRSAPSDYQPYNYK
ncbi:MAG: hypothetical protein MJZ13_02965 [Bacteroidales bacterium]|nr:hypothetical protein [Bacteroidales bacterium]